MKEVYKEMKYTRIIRKVLLIMVVLLISDPIPRYAASSKPYIQANAVIFCQNQEDMLMTYLGIDNTSINITAIFTPTNIIDLTLEKFTDLLENADVVFVNRYLPAELKFLRCLVEFVNGSRSNKGLVMFGFYTNQTNQELDLNPNQIELISPLLPVNLTATYRTSPRSSAEREYDTSTRLNPDFNEKKDFIFTDISWTSMPTISYRTILSKKEAATSLILSLEGTDALLANWTLPNTGGSVVYCSIEILENNLPFILWPYFNYLLYILTFMVKREGDLVENQMYTFREWPKSPIPHRLGILLWFSLISVCWIISIIVFLIMRRVPLLPIPPYVPLHSAP